jgi:hypothetical protein
MPFERPPESWDLSLVLARAEQEMTTGAGVLPFAGPPPEVQREMVEADRAWRNLAAQGREVRFEAHADGHVSIELTDSAGHALDEICPAGFFRLLKLAS